MLHAGGGADILNVSNLGDAAGHTGTLTATQLTGLGMGVGVEYHEFEQLLIALSSGGDDFFVAGTPSDAVLTLFAGNGTTAVNETDDTIDIGSIESAMSFDKNNVYQDAAIREQVSHALDMGAVKNQFNMVLNWKFKKLTLLATVHSEGRVLKWSTINPVRYFRDAATYYMNEYHYMQPRTVVDLRVEYNLLRNFGAYVQFRDLFDAPIRYTANDRFLNYARKGNPMIEIGFKGWF